MAKDTLGTLIGSGAGSEVYEYGKDRVCKLYRQGAGHVEYEFHKMQEAYKLGIPVPRPYMLVEIDGRRGFVMERIYGASLMDIMLDFLMQCGEKGIPYQDIFDSDVIQFQIKTTALILSQLHAQKCGLKETAKLSLYNGCLGNSYLTEDEKRIVQQLIDQLPDGESLCHGDPHPGNFIRQGNTIRMIDWNNSVKGHFLYDIAQYVLTMRYAALSLDWPDYADTFIREYQNEFSRVFLDEYQKIAHVELLEWEQWTIPVLVSTMGGNQPQRKHRRLLMDIRRGLAAL